MKKILILTLLLTTNYLLLASSVFATERIDFPNPSYLFHLYYDNGQLFADRDFEFKYDVIPEEYRPGIATTQFPFRGEIVNFLNQVAVTFEFDPRGGNPSFAEGKVKVRAPYVSDGQKAVFYDSQGRALLTIFVSDSSFCDDDGTCNSDRGEDSETCPNDCASAVAPPTSPPDTSDNTARNLILITALVIVLGVGGWYGFRKWRKSKLVQENDFTSRLPS